MQIGVYTFGQPHTSIEDAISSVSTCLEKVERMTGVQLERAFIGISGSHVVSNTSNASPDHPRASPSVSHAALGAPSHQRNGISTP